MIEVSYSSDKIEVKGHSGYAPPGQDIVCAAVSAMFLELVYSVEEMTTDNADYRIETGNSWFKIRNPSDTVCVLMDSFFVGINHLHEQYPEFVQFVQA